MVESLVLLVREEAPPVLAVEVVVHIDFLGLVPGPVHNHRPPLMRSPHKVKRRAMRDIVPALL